MFLRIIQKDSERIIIKRVVRPGSHIALRKVRTHDYRSKGNFPTVQKYSRVPGLKYSRARAHLYLSRYAWDLVSGLPKGGILDRVKEQVYVCVCRPVPIWPNFIKYSAREIF